MKRETLDGVPRFDVHSLYFCESRPARTILPGASRFGGGGDMLTMSFAAEFRRLEMTLNDFGRTQLPYAGALALTRTAELGRDEVRSMMPLTFDRPTPFSLNAITIVSARKTRLEARILVKDIQAEYLRLQEMGGMRQPKKQALVTPGAIKLNQYGNMTKKALATAKGRQNTFVGKVNGVGGFWRREKDGALTLLARFDGPKQVTPHPFFFPRVEAVMRRDFDRLLGQAIEHAMRSARA